MSTGSASPGTFDGGGRERSLIRFVLSATQNADHASMMVSNAAVAFAVDQPCIDSITGLLSTPGGWK